MNIRELAQAIHMHHRENYCWPSVDHVDGVVEVLGNGSFGCAYLLPDGRVLKVGEGIDATCIWINEAAKHFAMYDAPGRCMPVVWEFDTELYPAPEKLRVMVSPDGWARMPDGGLVAIEAVYEEREHITHKAWWYAVMEKVEAYVCLDRGDVSYIEDWGLDRGILNTDIYAKNCGKAADGRLVCFDPFYYQPPDATLRNMCTVRTGYTGPKAYKATASETYDRQRDPAVRRGAGRMFGEIVALHKAFDFNLRWGGRDFRRFDAAKR